MKAPHSRSLCLELITEKVASWPSLVPLAVFSALLVFYSAFLTQTSYFTRDPIDVATAIERSDWGHLLPADHLLYPATGWVLYRAAQILGVGNALIPLQVLSVVTGAAGAAILFSAIERLVGSWRIALLCSLLVALSYGYWRYAEEAMPYPVMMFFLAWSMALILKTGPGSGPAHFLLMGVVTALAVLYHQMALFVVPVVVVAILWHYRRDSREHASKGMLVYVGAFSLCVLVPYSLVILLVEKASTPEAILRFIAGNLFTVKTSLGLAQFSLTRALKAVFGIGNLFVGEVFILDSVATNSDLAHRFVSLVPAVSLPPAEYARPLVRFELLAALAGLVVVLVALLMLLFIRHLKSLWRNHQRVLVICLMWALPVVLFALWYFPENVHFWIPLLIPVGIILALLLQHAGEHQDSWLPRNGMRLGWLLVLALFTINLTGSILPAHKPGSNWNRDTALQIGRYARQDDLVITLGVGEYKHLPAYLDYYVGRYPLTISPVMYGGLSEKAFQQHLTSSFDNGQRAFVFGDVFESCLGYVGMSRLSGKRVGQIQGQVVQMFQDYSLREVDWEEGHPRLYELKRLEGENAPECQMTLNCDLVTLGSFTRCPLTSAP